MLVCSHSEKNVVYICPGPDILDQYIISLLTSGGRPGPVRPTLSPQKPPLVSIIPYVCKSPHSHMLQIKANTPLYYFDFDPNFAHVRSDKNYHSDAQNALEILKLFASAATTITNRAENTHKQKMTKYWELEKMHHQPFPSHCTRRLILSPPLRPPSHSSTEMLIGFLKKGHK